MEPFDLTDRNDTARAVFMLTALLGQEVTIKAVKGTRTGLLGSVMAWQGDDGFVLRVNVGGFDYPCEGSIEVGVDPDSPEPVRLLGNAVMAMRRP